MNEASLYTMLPSCGNTADYDDTDGGNAGKASQLNSGGDQLNRNPPFLSNCSRNYNH